MVGSRFFLFCHKYPPHLVGFLRSGVVFVAGNEKMIHAMGLGNRENQFQSDGGVMIPAIGLVDLISDVPVPIGMVVMAQAEADFSDVPAGPVFQDGPPIEGEFIPIAIDGFEQAKGNDVAIDGKEFFSE